MRKIPQHEPKCWFLAYHKCRCIKDEFGTGVLDIDVFNISACFRRVFANKILVC